MLLVAMKDTPEYKLMLRYHRTRIELNKLHERLEKLKGKKLKLDDFDRMFKVARHRAQYEDAMQYITWTGEFENIGQKNSILHMKITNKSKVVITKMHIDPFIHNNGSEINVKVQEVGTLQPGTSVLVRMPCPRGKAVRFGWYGYAGDNKIIFSRNDARGMYQAEKRKKVIFNPNKDF
jgi:hypothetical protein